MTLFKLRSFILMGLLLVSSLALADIQLDADHREATLDAEHPDFSISLATNPSTGFSWTYDTDTSSSLYRVTDFKNKRIETIDGVSPVGRPIMETWSFHVNDVAFKKSQTLNILFSSIKGSEKGKTINFIIEIHAK